MLESVRRVRSLSYSSRAGMCLIVRRLETWALSWHLSRRSAVTCLMLESVSSICGWGVSLTRPVLQVISSCVGREFLLHAPDEISLVVLQMVSFSYTPRFAFSLVVRREGNLRIRSASTIVGWRVFLTRPVLETV